MNTEKIENDYKALVGYHLDGRLMLFGGLCSHDQMEGAIIAFGAIIGSPRRDELNKEVEQMAGAKWKYPTLSDASKEFYKLGHTCFYCEKCMPSPTWPHVLKFAARMEAKLEKNRHKGDRAGWLKDHPWNLVERVLDETVELQQCFSASGTGRFVPPVVSLVKTPEETADECADVANFCMMVADSVTAQKSKAETTEASND
jgi:hypothetical protein